MLTSLPILALASMIADGWKLVMGNSVKRPSACINSHSVAEMQRVLAVAEARFQRK
jgi:hypothetical protein